MCGRWEWVDQASVTGKKSKAGKSLLNTAATHKPGMNENTGIYHMDGCTITWSLCTTPLWVCSQSFVFDLYFLSVVRDHVGCRAYEYYCWCGVRKWGRGWWCGQLFGLGYFSFRCIWSSFSFFYVVLSRRTLSKLHWIDPKHFGYQAPWSPRRMSQIWWSFPWPARTSPLDTAGLLLLSLSSPLPPSAHSTGLLWCCCIGHWPWCSFPANPETRTLLCETYVVLPTVPLFLLPGHVPQHMLCLALCPPHLDPYLALSWDCFISLFVL